MADIKALESQIQRFKKELATEKHAEEDVKSKEERAKTELDKAQDTYETAAENRRNYSDKAIKKQEEINKLERQLADARREEQKRAA